MTLPKLSILACLISLAVACVSHNRSQLALTVNRVANPDKGTAVVRATVTDKRRFQVEAPGKGAGARLVGDLLFGVRGGSPHHGSTASLDSWEETRDPALRARTIARPYDGQGIPGGNILLPAGDSVTKTVRGVLETGLREVETSAEVKQRLPASEPRRRSAAEVFVCLGPGLGFRIGAMPYSADSIPASGLTPP